MHPNNIMLLQRSVPILIMNDTVHTYRSVMYTNLSKGLSFSCPWVKLITKVICLGVICNLIMSRPPKKSAHYSTGCTLIIHLCVSLLDRSFVDNTSGGMVCDINNYLS